MKIGILGAGAIGGSLAQLWARQGHRALVSSRHPDALSDITGGPGSGITAGTVDEAIAFSDVLLDALPFGISLGLDADALAGKTLLSASNYYPQRDGQQDLGGATDTEAVARRLPRTRVVKAFNIIPAAVFRQRLTSPDSAPDIAVPIAGDDREALDTAAQLVRDAGFTPVAVGGLSKGTLFKVDTPPYGANWPADQLHAWLNEQGITDEA